MGSVRAIEALDNMLLAVMAVGAAGFEGSINGIMAGRLAVEGAKRIGTGMMRPIVDRIMGSVRAIEALENMLLAVMAVSAAGFEGSIDGIMAGRLVRAVQARATASASAALIHLETSLASVAVVIVE